MAVANDTEELWNELRKLASQLPSGLHADWKDTNNYEMTCACDKDYWWLDVCGMDPLKEDVQGTVAGKRLGLIMDIAVVVNKLHEAGAI